MNKARWVLFRFKFITVILLCTLFPLLMAAKPPIQVAKNVPPFLIDDFEDGNISETPKWWGFGELLIMFEDNDPKTFDGLGKKSLSFLGKTDHWLVGGIGTYLGLDGTQYNALKLIIKGSGEKSGNLTIELYDDDNGNWKVDVDPSNPGFPNYDDKFVYNLPITWKGWRTLIIPIARFRDDNPTAGDNIWNPDQKNGSGGLLQIQLLAFSSTQKGSIDFQIDSIKLFKAADPNTLLYYP